MSKRNTKSRRDQRKFDTIPFRIEFIRDLLDDKEINPMIDLAYCDSKSLVCNNMCGKAGHSDYQCRSMKCLLNKMDFHFNAIIKQIGGKLRYIKSGTTGHTFKGIQGDNDQEVNFGIKIVAYPRKERYGDIDDAHRPENAELLMIGILSKFVLNRQTPHIVLPIATFNANIEPFVELTRGKVNNSRKYDQFIERYNDHEYYDDVSVLISEWADEGDLLDYIRKNYKTFKTRHWRTLFFQLLSVLAIVQNEYPTFRHNDLKANNILVQRIESQNKNNKFKYTINGYEYIVSNIGFHIKLWDFDFACIPGLVENAKVNANWTNKINVKPKKNRYYDVHYFFNTLTKKGFFPQFYEAPEISKEVKNFVARVVPREYSHGKYVAEKGRILINKEFTTPDKLLKYDPFFRKIRMTKE